MKYYIGYFSDNYKAAKDVFVIMAETHSKACAMMIRDSYMNAYKKMGIATQAVMLEELPKHYIYAE